MAPGSVVRKSGAALVKTSSESYCVILPAAGFGTRMGSPESKEMLFAEDESFPMIQHALDLLAEENCRIVLPTRKEKKSLIDFVTKHSPHVIIQIIEKSKEWPDTILQTHPYWLDKNLLILPDTRWSPENEILKLPSLLDSHHFAFSTFTSSVPETWGVFRDQPWAVCDKPPHSVLNENKSNTFCWGHIAFQKELGQPLFSNILKSHHSKSFESLPNSTSAGFIRLDSFCDLTRP